MDTISESTAMEFVHVAVAVLSLLSLGQSVPVSSCKNLLQTIEIQGRDQLLGTWNYMGESTDIPGSKVFAKMFAGNAWWNFTAARQSSDIISFQNQKMFGVCFSLSYKTTVEGNTLVMEQPYPSTAFLLNTGCPDCLVVFSNYTIGTSTYQGLQLLSRRTKVSAAELEEFKQQVECVNLPAPTLWASVSDVCPDPSVSQDTKTMDFSSGSNVFTATQLNALDQILKSQTGVQTLIDMVSSSFGTADTSAKTTEN